ncbi:MAG: gamma carbonic anhydrase family protein [Halobacterium sp.]
MLHSFDGTTPDVADSAYVAEEATVIGDVTIGPEASVWPGAVLRGDHGEIVLGERANVQDNATLHEGTVLESGATVGHNAVVHDATVGERSVVGIGAVVLDGATVGRESVVAANSTVADDAEIPDNVLAMGTPAEPVRDLEDSRWASTGDRYAELAKQYAATSHVVEDGPVMPE